MEVHYEGLTSNVEPRCKYVVPQLGEGDVQVKHNTLSIPWYSGQ